MQPCKHCKVRLGRFGRGLCSACYYNLDIRHCYPPNLKYAPKADGDCRTTLAPRKAGESPWWCLWCYRWVCDGPMKLCEDCEADYEARAVGMPVEGVVDVEACG